MYMSKYFLTIIATLLILIGMLVMIGYSIYFQDSKFEREPLTLSSTDYTYWMNQYKEFLEKYSGASHDIQHVMAHMMGGILYENLGERGIAVCDNSFSSGCYHELLGRAVAHDGTENAQKLNDACKSTAGNGAIDCQHGIGHGLLSHVGYDIEDLQDTLNICNSLSNHSPIWGCAGGAFMEYNMRTVLSVGSKVGLRPFDKSNPHYPCRDLDGESQPACYFWQTQWWPEFLFGSPKRVFTVMGEWCREVESFATLSACFKGLGQHSGQLVGYDPQRSKELCLASSTNSDEQLMCLREAVNLYRSIPERTGAKEILCRDVDSSERENCLGPS